MDSTQAWNFVRPCIAADDSKLDTMKSVFFEANTASTTASFVDGMAGLFDADGTVNTALLLLYVGLQQTQCRVDKEDDTVEVSRYQTDNDILFVLSKGTDGDVRSCKARMHLPSPVITRCKAKNQDFEKIQKELKSIRHDETLPVDVNKLCSMYNPRQAWLVTWTYLQAKSNLRAFDMAQVAYHAGDDMHMTNGKPPPISSNPNTQAVSVELAPSLTKDAVAWIVGLLNDTEYADRFMIEYNYVVPRASPSRVPTDGPRRPHSALPPLPKIGSLVELVRNPACIQRQKALDRAMAA